MSSSFEPGGDNRIHTGFLKCDTLFGSSRCADRNDVFRTTLIKYLSCWDSEDEAEYTHLRVKQHANLIFKSHWRIHFVCRTRRSQGSEMDREWGETPIESVFVRCSGTLVLHRNP